MELLKTEAVGIEACAIARDIQAFDLLIEDMETELGERWGSLNFEEGMAYLDSPEALDLEFITVAVDQQDEADLSPVVGLITLANENDVKVILVAHDLSPMALHQLLRQGADDFAPYPLPEGTLHDAIERISTPPAAPVLVQAVGGGNGNRDGVVIPIQGMAGGVGSTTVTVNFAWEMAKLCDGSDMKVCILDLDLQFGSVSTYLDLPRRESIFELISDTEAMDSESFASAMTGFDDRMDILTAPADALPLDLIGPEDVTRILDKATEQYDFVFVDMPQTLIQWSETVLQRAHIYFAVLEMEMRSAQNALRFIRALKSEELPLEKVRYILNRAPKFTDITGRSRIKRLAENLDISIDVFFPDGGKQVLNSCDHGLPISETAPKNPLRKEIQKMAQSVFDLNVELEAAN